jgi:Arginine methyltransferase oligomerization subdomain/Ribosomal protein L11 methyltransferase (PrmA)
MYSVRQFGDMISDGVRYKAYEDSIARSVHAGHVVAEIGCGPAVFALLACRAGAKRVYAIETEDIIDVARQIAVANGVADRIHFFQSDSSKVKLPEPVNVIVSDIRGVLPLFDGAVASLRDAKERLLAPEGVLIPRRDVLKAAIIEAEKVYSNLISPWKTCVGEVKLSIPLHLVLNTGHSTTVKVEQLISEPEELCTLDYMGNPETNVSVKLEFRANRNGTAHGICVWFETELYEDIGFSSGPESPVTIYGQLFLPWLEPVVLEEGQEILVTLHANLVGKEYIWRWETEIAGADGGEKVHFRQSTFEGANVSSRTLRRHAVDHVPVLTAEGEAERFLLGAMDGRAALEEIAKRAAERFPEVYSSHEEAFERVSELARKFSW